MFCRFSPFFSTLRKRYATHNQGSRLWVPKYNKPTGFEKKTRWDKLQLLAQIIGAFAIPLSIIALIIGIWQFSAQQNNENQRTAQQQQAEFQNLKDQQQQTTLETYLDRMQELLTNGHLGDPKASAQIRAIARARTITALSRLDPDRKRTIIQFLYEANLINSKPIVDLKDADLSNAHLNEMNLTNSNFSGAHLSGVTFKNTALSGTDFSGADLKNAHFGCTQLSFEQCVSFDNVDFSDADLSGARFECSPGFERCIIFDNVDLRSTSLEKADLSDISLRGAQFGCSKIGIDSWVPCKNLRNANLNNVDLSGTDLSQADLSGTDLSQANLEGATGTTLAQLNEAKSLKDAIMPDGSKHP